MTSYKEYLIKNIANAIIIKSDLEDFHNILNIVTGTNARRSRKSCNIDDTNNNHVLVAASKGSTLKTIDHNLGSWLKSSISELKHLDPVEQIKNRFYQNVNGTEQSQLNIADNVYHQDTLSVESSDNIMSIKDDLHDEHLSKIVYPGLISDIHTQVLCMAIMT